MTESSWANSVVEHLVISEVSIPWLPGTGPIKLYCTEYNKMKRMGTWKEWRDRENADIERMGTWKEERHRKNRKEGRQEKQGRWNSKGVEIAQASK